MRDIFWSLGLIVALLGCGEQLNKEVSYDEQAKPEDLRFSKEVFINWLNEPVELEVLPNGQVLFIERKGGVKLYDPSQRKMIMTDSIPVFYGMEDGLLGLAIDPDFKNNSWIYLYYSPAGDEPKQQLSRFSFSTTGLRNKKIILEVPTQRDECCHTGGSIEFGKDGLLYLSTGDDSNPFNIEGYAPIDEREGNEEWDARRTAANTNDLRGKILRIKVERDGSYTIPEGNLFEDNDPLTRPEIYVMGCRNPYRISVDKKTGWLYWGDVGPDANYEHPNRGPRGYDEINATKEPGFFGWPMFIANNIPYGDWDFDKKETRGFFDPEKPVNDSRYNTGLTNLPKAKPAMIYYPYAASEEFPMLGNGGRTAMVGPVFYTSDYPTQPNRFPAYFDGRLFIFDWMRNWIFTVKVDENSHAADFQPLFTHMEFSNISDMAFAPDGSLYVLEYGKGWFMANEDARLSQITFNKGNLPPRLEANLSETSGGVPLQVVLDASASTDFEQKKLRFKWEVNNEIFTDSLITYTFTKAGIYYPKVTVTDNKGLKQTKQFKVEVGNETPKLTIEIQGNSSFYWPGRVIDYEVILSDEEDGKIGNGINESEVIFDIATLEGYDKSEVLGHQMPVSSGESLMLGSDCTACHKLNEKSIGPSFADVAKKYKNDPYALDYLSNKIINGGGGVWGEHVMSAHPDFSSEEAQSIVQYIMKLADTKIKYPLKGQYEVAQKENNNFLLFNASYTDKGAYQISGRKVSETVILRPTKIEAIDFDASFKAGGHKPDNKLSFIHSLYQNAWVMYKNIDLTNVKSIDVYGLVMENIDEAYLSVRMGGENSKEFSGTTFKKGESMVSIPIPEGTVIKDDLYLVFLNENEKNQLMVVHNLKFVLNEK